jgi:L-ascorbate metabolism protein UlaG (beta-lactamase superfamily)
MSLGRSFQLTWLGHSTFFLKTGQGKNLLFDPWLKNNPACPDAMKKIAAVDLMLISHGHFDHIEDAVEIALEHGPEVIGIFELCHWMQSKGVQNTLGMNKGGTVQSGDIRITMVSADHSCGIIDKDATGKEILVYGGDPCGFVVTLEDGFKIYFAGDTNVFGDMKLIGDLYKPDVALLPIGGHFTMSPTEAAMALRLLGVKKVVPMHYGTFPVLTGTPEALADAASDIQGLEVVSIKPGQVVP